MPTPQRQVLLARSDHAERRIETDRTNECERKDCVTSPEIHALIAPGTVGKTDQKSLMWRGEMSAMMMFCRR